MSKWQTVSSKTVYNNPWILISHCDVLTPNNTNAIYGRVHFKNIAVGVIPIDSDGKIQLIGQERYMTGEYSWEIPEGGALLGGNLLEAAKRELREETGLEACYWEEILRLHTSNSVTDEIAIIYLATDLTRSAPEPEHCEVFKYRKIDSNEIIENISTGLITDAMTVSALLKYHTMIHSS